MSALRLILLLGILLSTPATAETQVLDGKLHHLRVGPREWSEFPEQPEAERLAISFDVGAPNSTEMTLRVRQQDLKQNWTVALNGKVIGRLRRDENDLIEYFPVPPDTLKAGKNQLVIEQPRLAKRTPDDVRIGEIILDPRPRSEALSESTVSVTVVDSDSSGPIPARLTILNSDGAMQTPGAKSNDHLAVRPGTIYTSTGKATFGLPLGDYTIRAGRGFEYSLDSKKISLNSSGETRVDLRIRRVVDTSGYVACDTHVHSLTHSGHGDATVQERMITIAAEGIELPIATDHNVHIDHEPFAREMNVRNYFTPVMGNEVTTKVGHFNIFPVDKGSSPPDYKSRDWAEIFNGIYYTPRVEVVILNHGRDLHGGTTPLGPKLFHAAAGGKPGRLEAPRQRHGSDQLRRHPDGCLRTLGRLDDSAQRWLLHHSHRKQRFARCGSPFCRTG